MKEESGLRGKFGLRLRERLRLRPENGASAR
jgi:hypothetical protein